MFDNVLRVARSLNFEMEMARVFCGCAEMLCLAVLMIDIQMFTRSDAAILFYSSSTNTSEACSCVNLVIVTCACAAAACGFVFMYAFSHTPT